jgi:hypothetical protein
MLGSGGTTTLQQVAPINVLNGINTGNSWFDPASFVKTNNLVQGNTGRNIWSGPNLWGLNASVSRTISVTERYKLQLRADALNAWNKAQFSNPNTDRGNANFSYITSTISSGSGVNGTGGGRVIILAAKIIF